MQTTSLEKALKGVSFFLSKQGVPYMVIGGIANLFWGEPRATLDVDVTIKVSEENIKAFVGLVADNFQVLVSEPVQFVEKTRVLPVKTVGGIGVDFIFALLPYEELAISRAVTQSVLGQEVKVCTAEDLILHKIISERVKDREDVRKIIAKHRENLDHQYLEPRIQQLTHDLGRPEIEEFYQECLS